MTKTYIMLCYDIVSSSVYAQLRNALSSFFPGLLLMEGRNDEIGFDFPPVGVFHLLYVDRCKRRCEYRPQTSYRLWDAIPHIQGLRDLLLLSSDCLTVLLPSLLIVLGFSFLSCLALSESGRARMERKRTTMGKAAQIRYKSVLPTTVYIPPIATVYRLYWVEKT